MFTSRYKTELSLKARSPRWSLAVKSSCIKRATMYIVYLKYTSYTWALKGLRPATKIEQLGVKGHGPKTYVCGAEAKREAIRCFKNR
jgi:hypothetical protein